MTRCSSICRTTIAPSKSATSPLRSSSSPHFFSPRPDRFGAKKRPGMVTRPHRRFPFSGQPQAYRSSAQKQARLPAHAFGRGPQFFEGPVLDLANPFLADAEQVADLAQAVGAVAGQAEAEVE